MTIKTAPIFLFQAVNCLPEKYKSDNRYLSLISLIAISQFSQGLTTLDAYSSRKSPHAFHERKVKNSYVLKQQKGNEK